MQAACVAFGGKQHVLVRAICIAKCARRTIYLAATGRKRLLRRSVILHGPEYARNLLVQIVSIFAKILKMLYNNISICSQNTPMPTRQAYASQLTLAAVLSAVITATVTAGSLSFAREANEPGDVPTFKKVEFQMMPLQYDGKPMMPSSTDAAMPDMREQMMKEMLKRQSETFHSAPNGQMMPVPFGEDGMRSSMSSWNAGQQWPGGMDQGMQSSRMGERMQKELKKLEKQIAKMERNLTKLEKSITKNESKIAALEAKIEAATDQETLEMLHEKLEVLEEKAEVLSEKRDELEDRIDEAREYLAEMRTTQSSASASASAQ